jgi:hypothetical protein
MKKMRKFENGGDIESMQGQNPGIDDDTRARAMAYVQGQLQDETGKTSSIRRNTETGELYDTAMPKAKPKAAAPKKESKPVSNKPTSVSSGGKDGKEKTGFEQKKDKFLAKSAAEPSATKTETSETRSLSIPKNREKTGFELKKEKFMNRGMRAGGKVSSASSRADGIAQRGKTKGRMV